MKNDTAKKVNLNREGKANYLYQIKEKLGELERTLLAIDEVSNICQENIASGQKAIDLEHGANLLNYLIEPALFQLEAVRKQMDEMIAAGNQQSTAQESL